MAAAPGIGRIGLQARCADRVGVQIPAVRVHCGGSIDFVVNILPETIKIKGSGKKAGHPDHRYRIVSSHGQFSMTLRKVTQRILDFNYRVCIYTSIQKARQPAINYF